MGAERLHDRLRRRARARRPLGRPRRAQEGLPPGPGRLHRLLRAVRRRALARLPRRRPRAAGDGRRAHAPHLPRAAPPRLRPRAQGRRHRAVVGRGRCRRRVRAPDRRAPGAGQLALGVPGQPAPQRARPRLRDPPAARGARPGGAQVRPARCRAALGVGRQPGGRHRRGHGLGLAQRADPGRVRPRRGVGRLARRPLVPPPEPDPRAGGHPAPCGGPGRRQLARLLRRLRGARARRRAVPHRRVARVDPAGRLHDRPRPSARRPHGLPRRTARGALRPPRRGHRRLAALRGRRPLVDHPRRRRAQLGGGLPPRQPPRRRRRGAHAPLARRCGHGAAPAAALRHGLRPLRHDAPDRGRPRGGLPGRHPRYRPPAPPPSPPSITPGSS